MPEFGREGESLGECDQREEHAEILCLWVKSRRKGCKGVMHLEPPAVSPGWEGGSGVPLYSRLILIITLLTEKMVC